MQNPPCAVALGSNLGRRLHYLHGAVQALSAHTGICQLQLSPVYESKAHTWPGAPPAPPYLNAVVLFRTTCTAEELLNLLLEVEQHGGRQRSVGRPWAPRTLDLDLLLYGSQRVHGPRLQVPHPRMGERRFVLSPLADLAPHLHVPPPFDVDVATLLARCPDPTTPHRRDDLSLHPS
ncbi:MAG: 2-amino-4-hydroxy-6-hydroxymethyldihydropteridine diphosphokinase [Bacteroidota bacterium]